MGLSSIAKKYQIYTSSPLQELGIILTANTADFKYFMELDRKGYTVLSRKFLNRKQR